MNRQHLNGNKGRVHFGSPLSFCVDLAKPFAVTNLNFQSITESSFPFRMFTYNSVMFANLAHGFQIIITNLSRKVVFVH